MSGRGVYFGVSHANHPKSAEFQGSPIFVGSPVCLHPLTQNDQIRHGNSRGDGRVLGGQQCYCICTNASCILSAIAEFLVFWGFRFWRSFSARGSVIQQTPVMISDDCAYS